MIYDRCVVRENLQQNRCKEQYKFCNLCNHGEMSKEDIRRNEQWKTVRSSVKYIKELRQ
jgi:hypothetical protein